MSLNHSRLDGDDGCIATIRRTASGSTFKQTGQFLDDDAWRLAARISDRVDNDDNYRWTYTLDPRALPTE